MTGAERRRLTGSIRDARESERRVLVAISGPPAAGKSTLAAELADGLGPEAVVVAMDGFHLDNGMLRRRGLLERKGAPETFDAFGFLALIKRLASDREVFVPVFNREMDVAVAGADVVGTDHKFVLVEGNYLLLDQAPWSRLHTYWDLSVAIRVDRAELRSRLVNRWLDHGLSAIAADERADGNDMRNADLVLSRSIAADLVLPQ